jgi:hypothetical protein
MSFRPSKRGGWSSKKFLSDQVLWRIRLDDKKDVLLMANMRMDIPEIDGKQSSSKMPSRHVRRGVPEICNLP